METLNNLLSTYEHVLSATEALADLLDLPYWDGEEAPIAWCRRMDTLTRGSSAARRSVLADLVTWESDADVSPTFMALTAILRSTRHDGSDDGVAQSPTWSAAAHAIGPDGMAGLGSHRAVARALSSWGTVDAWRDDAEPFDMGIPVQIGSQTKQRPQVVTYKPLVKTERLVDNPQAGKARWNGSRLIVEPKQILAYVSHEEARTPMEPTSDDYVRESVAETFPVRVTPAWCQARQLVKDDGTTYVRHGDRSYSVVSASGSVERYASRAEYLAGRRAARRATVRARAAQARAERRQAVEEIAEQVKHAIEHARDLRQLGDVTVRGTVVAVIRPGQVKAHVMTAEGRRLPGRRDLDQYSRAVAATL